MFNYCGYVIRKKTLPRGENEYLGRCRKFGAFGKIYTNIGHVKLALRNITGKTPRIDYKFDDINKYEIVTVGIQEIIANEANTLIK